MGIVSLIPPNITNGPLGNLVTALFRPARAIGPFAAQVTIEEVHQDELEITRHPVEIGASITDHAYKKPAEVIIRCGFSNASLASQITEVAGILSLFTSGSVGPLNYSEQVYQQMLALQQSRSLFSVTTGKRTYQNMLMKSISVHTDDKTENVLMVTVHCTEVILVSTQALPSLVNSNGVTPTPTNPVLNDPLQNSGTLNLVPATPSPGGAAPASGWLNGS